MKKMRKWRGLVAMLAVLVSFGVFSKVQARFFVDDSGANAAVYATAIQVDGKTLIGGEFTLYNGVARNHIARLNADGTLDQSFNPDLSAVDSVMAIAIQPDGKIVIGGIMNTVPSGSNRSIYRLNTDGTVDVSFAEGVYINGSIRTIAIQADKKIIIGGYFNTYNGIAIKNIARINIDGSLDSSFNSHIVEGTVRAIAIRSDGKIVIGGGFILDNDQYWRNMAHLNIDGDIDTSLSYGGITTRSASVNAIVIQPDDSVIIGGDFNVFEFVGYLDVRNIARIDKLGIPDMDFSCQAGGTSYWCGAGTNTAGIINALAIRSDGKIIVGGSSGHLGVLNPDGTLNIDTETWNGQIFSVSQVNDKIIIGGDFTSYNGTPSNRVAQLNADGTFDDGSTFFTSFSISIKTPPKKTLYNVGDNLDLSGLVVTLTRSNENTQNVQDIEFMDFASNGITTSLTDGTVLEGSETEVIIKFSGFSVNQEISFDPVWSSTINNNENNETNIENLVVITHGLNGSAKSSWLPMMRNLILKQSKENTVVRLYDWENGAHSPCGGTCWFQADNLAVFKPIYENAANQGQYLAKHITEYKTPPRNIHLIAHSVGSNLIEETVKKLHEDLENGSWKEYYQEHPDAPKPFIHLTFLDAFAPWDSANSDRYGNLYGFDGYAEQYVDSADLAYTNEKLQGAVNFDITYLTNSSNRTHDWPPKFYNDSFAETYKAPGDNSVEGNYPKLGFRFARESKDYIDPQIKNNQWCVITNVSEPYRRCLNDSEDENRDVIITDQNNPVSIQIPNDSMDFGVDVSQFISNGVGVLPEITMVDYSNAFAVQIPDQTTVTNDNSVWDGVFMAPEKASEYCLVCNLDGNWKLNYSAIKIGLDDSTLSFNRGVRIFFPGEGGKNVGYGRDGEGFHEIINPCYDDSQGTGDALPVDGACKIDINNDRDLVIWTKHFTTFAAYELNDVISPTTSISAFGTQGNNDWFTSDVQVTLSATDNEDGSGVEKTEYSLDEGATWAEYSEPFTISNEGTNKVEYRSTDKAGNIEEIQIATIKIDKTAPNISINAPFDGEKYILNSSVNADWSATDEVSGVDSATGTVASGNAIDTSSVGLKEFTITATDVAGNSLVKTIQYNTVYVFGGFQNPATKDKSFNGNGTIPVKFQLTDNSETAISDAIATLTIDDDIVALPSGKSNDGNEFKYKDNQYIFNLSPKNTKLKSGEHTLHINLDDGTVYSLSIAIR